MTAILIVDYKIANLMQSFKKLFLTSLTLFAVSTSVTLFAQTVTDTADTVDVSCVDIPRTLTLRSRDSVSSGAVSDLQFFLNERGYLKSDPTGYFGAATLQAVKDFQRANGITPNGIVGPNTRAKIKNLSCLGFETQPVEPRATTTGSVNTNDQQSPVTATLQFLGTGVDGTALSGATTYTNVDPTKSRTWTWRARNAVQASARYTLSGQNCQALRSFSSTGGSHNEEAWRPWVGTGFVGTQFVGSNSRVLGPSYYGCTVEASYSARDNSGRTVVSPVVRVTFAERGGIVAPTICSYAAPASGCTYVQGPNYNPVTQCGMIQSCGSNVVFSSSTPSACALDRWYTSSGVQADSLSACRCPAGASEVLDSDLNPALVMTRGVGGSFQYKCVRGGQATTTVLASPTYDLNGDGRETISDLVNFARVQYGDQTLPNGRPVTASNRVADYNKDGHVNVSDLRLLRDRLGIHGLDLSANGVLDQADITQWTSSFGHFRSGNLNYMVELDLNADGRVDSQDEAFLKQRFGGSASIPPGSTCHSEQYRDVSGVCRDITTTCPDGTVVPGQMSCPGGQATSTAGSVTISSFTGENTSGGLVLRWSSNSPSRCMLYTYLSTSGNGSTYNEASKRLVSSVPSSSTGEYTSFIKTTSSVPDPGIAQYRLECGTAFANVTVPGRAQPSATTSPTTIEFRGGRLYQNSFSLGDTIDASVYVRNVAKGHQALYSLRLVSAESGSVAAGSSGSTGQSSELTSSNFTQFGSANFSLKTGPSYLEVPGTYDLTVAVAPCSSNGCNFSNQGLMLTDSYCTGVGCQYRGPILTSTTTRITISSGERGVDLSPVGRLQITQEGITNASNPSAARGAIIKLAGTVRNNGRDPVGVGNSPFVGTSFGVTYQIVGESKTNAYNDFGTLIIVPGLKIDGVSSLPVSVTLDGTNGRFTLQAGMYSVRMCADFTPSVIGVGSSYKEPSEAKGKGGQVSEYDESNNCSPWDNFVITDDYGLLGVIGQGTNGDLYGPVASSILPDLAVATSGLQNDISALTKTGDLFSLYTEVTNLGNAYAARVYSRMSATLKLEMAGKDGAGNATLVSQKQINLDIAPGEKRQNLGFNTSVPTSYNGREFAYRICVEPLKNRRGVVSEVTDSNNCTSWFNMSASLSGSVTFPGSPVAQVPIYDKVRQALATRLAVPLAQVTHISTEEKMWSDGCLGVREEGAMCTTAIVPGYIVKVMYQQKIYVYHTDREGRQIVYSGEATNSYAQKKPDLEVVTWTLSSATIGNPTKTGELAFLETTIRNKGQELASVSYTSRVNFALQRSQGVDGGGVLTTLVSGYEGVMYPNDQKTRGLNYTFPSSYNNSQFSLRVCVDMSMSTSGEIDESDETNNCSPWRNVTVDSSGLVAMTDQLPTANLTIARRTIALGESIGWSLSSTNAQSCGTYYVDQNGTRTTIAAPTTVTNVSNGLYGAEYLPKVAGSYTYRAICYSGANGQGLQSAPSDVMLTITSGASTAPTIRLAQPLSNAASPVRYLSTDPIPVRIEWDNVTTRSQINFVVERINDTLVGKTAVINSRTAELPTVQGADDSSTWAGQFKLSQPGLYIFNAYLRECSTNGCPKTGDMGRITASAVSGQPGVSVFVDAR